jgi:BirA family biotin operon repressor/biotin-[acetyl-CoA-carboxylase] ligase
MTKIVFDQYNIVWLPSCHSTNTFALEFCKNNDISDIAIIATQDQTNGRGQRGNLWISEPNKNLTFSIIVPHTIATIFTMFQWNMISSIVVYLFIKEIASDVNIKIKWPNDIFVNKKKMGGLLIESLSNQGVIKKIVIGIGLNINQTNFGYLNATSLGLETNLSFDLKSILVKFKDIFYETVIQYAKKKNQDLQNDYENLLLYFNTNTTFKNLSNDTLFTGCIEGVDTEGKLKIRVDNQTQLFDKQQIKLILS